MISTFEVILHFLLHYFFIFSLLWFSYKNALWEKLAPNVTRHIWIKALISVKWTFFGSMQPLLEKYWSEDWNYPILDPFMPIIFLGKYLTLDRVCNRPKVWWLLKNQSKNGLASFGGLFWILSKNENESTSHINFLKKKNLNLQKNELLYF